MKPFTPALVVLTATGNLAEAKARITRWQDLGSFAWPTIIIENGGITEERLDDGMFLIDRRSEWLGSVGAMLLGVQTVRKACPDAEVIVALHDDVEIDEPGWDVRVLDHFTRERGCGLAGFSGATGLGDARIYHTPYDPMQLARQGFRSNMRDAEAHGQRSTTTQRVVCHDGFSLIGRASWWVRGEHNHKTSRRGVSPWQELFDLGMVHHAYDSAMGVLAYQTGWESWYLPIACHHLGGRTAVANEHYQRWAMSRTDGGDAGFWNQAHAALYGLGRGTLPLRVER